MQQSKVQALLNLSLPNDVVTAIMQNYVNALGEYRKENWQYFGNEIGQFVECTRRLIEFIVQGTFTPLINKLPIFNEKILTQWACASSAIDEAYRIIIPRVLFSMYCIRNKRGMVHKNHIDPNRMDATILLYNSKWVLSEFVRLNSTFSFEETYELVNSIMNKEINFIWNIGSATRILDTKMSCADKILCLLYLEDKQTESSLFNSIEYSNLSTFRNVLQRLHSARMIEYTKTKSSFSSICTISPLGEQRAEELLK